VLLSALPAAGALCRMKSVHVTCTAVDPALYSVQVAAPAGGEVIMIMHVPRDNMVAPCSSRGAQQLCTGCCNRTTSAEGPYGAPATVASFRPMHIRLTGQGAATEAAIHIEGELLKT
jgi:hypothetical protein